MSGDYEKKFKKTVASLVEKYQEDKAMMDIIKYMKKSFMFCDLEKMDQPLFDHFIEEASELADSGALKKAIEDFCYYLKDIRDEEKVKAQARKAASSSGTGSVAPSSPERLNSDPATPGPSDGARSQQQPPTETDLRLLANSLELISMPPVQTSPQALSDQPTTSNEASGKKRKIQLVPLGKDDQKATNPGASAFTDGLEPLQPHSQVDEIPRKMPKADEHASNLESQDEDSAHSSEYLTEVEARALQRIEKLDRYLQEEHKKIKALEKSDFAINEITDENENNSVTCQTERLKVRWAKTYKKFVKLIKDFPHLVDEDVLKNHNIKIHKDVRFKTKLSLKMTSYPAIDQKVCDFVNKEREVPDYLDIFKIVKETNSSNKLKLSDREVENVAETILKGVIKELKKRRERDFLLVQSTRVDEELNMADDFQTDPAEKDPELKKKLEESKAEGELKLQQVVQSFVQQQGDKQGGDDQEENEEDDDDEDEEDEDEDVDESEDGLAESETGTTYTDETAPEESQDSAEIDDPFASEKEPEKTQELAAEPQADAGSPPKLRSHNLSTDSDPAESVPSLSSFLEQPDQPSEVKENTAEKKKASPLKIEHISYLPYSKTKVNQVMPLSDSKQTAMPKRSILNEEEPIVID